MKKVILTQLFILATFYSFSQLQPTDSVDVKNLTVDDIFEMSIENLMNISIRHYHD